MLTRYERSEIETYKSTEEEDAENLYLLEDMYANLNEDEDEDEEGNHCKDCEGEDCICCEYFTM